MPPQNYPSRVPAFGNNAEVFRSRPSKFFGVETLPGGFPFRSCSHTYSDSDSDEESTASEESIEIVVGKNAEALPTFLTGKAPPPPPRFIPPPPAPSKQRPVIRRGRSSSSSSSTTPFLRNGPPDAPLVASRKPPQQQREQQHRQSLPPQHPSQPLPVSSEARVRNSDAFSTDGGPIAYSPSRRYSQPQLSVEGVADLRRVAGIVPGRSLSPPPALPSTYANSNMWNGIHPTPNGLGIPFGGIFGAWGSPPMSLWLAFTAMTMAQRQGTNQYPAGKAHRRSRASNAGGSHRQRMKGRWSATGWNKTCSSPKNRKSSPIISDSQQTLQSRVLKDINLQYTSAPQPFHSAVPAIIRAASPTPTSSAASEISMQDSLLSSTTFGTLGHAQRQYLFRMTTSPVPIGASTLPIYPSGSLSLPGSIDSYHLDPFPFPANGMFGTNDGGNSNVGTAMASPVGSDASTATAASASLLGRPQRPFPSGLPQSRGLGGIVDGGPVGMSRDADAMGSLSIALSALNLADTTGVAWPGSNGQGVPPFWPLHTANGAAGAARWRQQHFSQQPFAVTHGPGSNWVLQPPQVQSAPMLMSPPPPRIPAQQSLNTPASADTTASPSDRKIASVKRRSRALTVPSTECPLTPMAPQLACALPAFSQSEGPVLAPQVVTPSVLFSTPAPPLLQPPSGAVDEIVSTAVEQNMAKLSSTSTLGTLPQRQSDTLTNARLTSAISAASSHTEPTTATGNTKSGRSPKARGPTRTTEEKTPVSVSSPTPSGSRTVSRGRKAATGLGRVDMVPAGRGGGHEGTAAVAAETGDRGTSPPIFFRGGEKGM
ncbi:hypothetical protein DFJ73DRAFT_92730 [Zopfochytrium polystomum]|nr:hypothetical protein DFJ73DRAFT_92730 [Zopfochytrium polystomum]